MKCKGPTIWANSRLSYACFMCGHRTGPVAFPPANFASASSTPFDTAESLDGLKNGRKKHVPRRDSTPRKAQIPTRDKLLTKPHIPAQFTDKQKRFLEAYSSRPWRWAETARVAGVHRCSAYRWLNDPAFDAARKAIEDAERKRIKQQTDAMIREFRAKLRAEAAASTTRPRLRRGRW
jgi:hypothetical protein